MYTRKSPEHLEKPTTHVASTAPRVSVIIPNYNHAQYVSAAIQSVLSQTYRSFEIIVVDDGSTDNSREIVAQFGDQVRYIWQENHGLGGARNTGIRASTSEFIGLLDADDQWQPGYLEQMLRMAEQHPDAAVFYCRAQGMDVKGDDLPQIFGGPVAPPGQIYPQLLRANFLIPSTVLIRRSVLTTVGLFEQTLRAIHGCEDWDLWLRIAPDYAIIGTSASLVRYRLHANTFSANPTRMQTAVRTVIEKHFGADDGQWQSWSSEKRRAYGGVYRYHALTSVQRQCDWPAAALYLRQALQADPTLASDLDLFYDLALGAQPSGFRGAAHQLTLQANAHQLDATLATVFDLATTSLPEQVRTQTYGTAYLALGLVAYNSDELGLSRRFLSKALWAKPMLWRDRRVIGNLLKSLAGKTGLGRLRQLYRNGSLR
jgi:glycosyltransferase involved in cell wall biosynthesis